LQPPAADGADNGWYRVTLYSKETDWFQVNWDDTLALNTFACYQYACGAPAYLQVVGNRPVKVYFPNNDRECRVQGLHQFQQPLTDSDWRYLQRYGV
jgi:hypothetical protein